MIVLRTTMILIAVIVSFLTPFHAGAEDSKWSLIEKTPDGFSVYYDPSSVHPSGKSVLSVLKRYTPPAGDVVKETLLTSDMDCKNRTIRLIKGEVYYNDGRIEELGEQSVPAPIEEGTVMHRLYSLICKD